MALVAAFMERSNFSALPEAGGILDQDAYLMWDVIRYLNIRDSIRENPEFVVDEETEFAEDTAPRESF